MGRRRRKLSITLLAAIALVSCGDDDAADDEGTTTADDTTTTTIEADVPSTTSEGPTTTGGTTTSAATTTTISETITDGEPTTTTAPPTDSTTVTTTAVANEADDGISGLAARGLLRVPDDQASFCEAVVDANEIGTVAARLRDPTNGGDLYVLCIVVAADDAPEFVELVAPQGDRWALDLEVGDDIGVPRRGFADQPTLAIVGTTSDGRSRTIGIIEFPSFESGFDDVDDPGTTPTSRVVQLHVWLPHDRSAGEWGYTFSVAGAPTSGVLDVARPCASSQSVSNGDPFFFDTELRIAGSNNVSPPDESDRALASENCRLAPDLIGAERTAAGSEARAALDRLGIDEEVGDSEGGCHGPDDGSIVSDQFPDPHFWIEEFGDFDLTYTAECPALPDGLVGRPYAEVKAVFDALDADHSQWSYSSDCPTGASIVTGFGDGSEPLAPGDWAERVTVICGTTSISGHVFVDADGDGQRSAGEGFGPDLTGVEVAIRDGGGEVTPLADGPDGDGSYRFDVSGGGTYTVEVSGLRAGASVVGGTSRTVDLDPGDAVGNIDFPVQL